MSEYISIKEFADRAGVSYQAIYQRINKDLKPYLKIIKGKKTLDSTGVEAYFLKRNFEGKIEEKIEVEKNQKINSDILKLLTSQLEQKDKQIEQLNERLNEASERLKEASERLKEANSLNQNNQVLIGREQRAIMDGNGQSARKGKRTLWNRIFKGDFKDGHD